MTNLLLYLPESTFCLLLFYIFYITILKQETCFQYNRFYLLLTPMLSLVIPLVEISFLPTPKPLTVFVSKQLPPVVNPVSTIKSPETIPVTAVTPTPELPIITPEAPPVNWETGLVWLYGAITGLLLWRLLRQVYRLQVFKKQTQGAKFYWQEIPVHPTNGLQATFSFGNCIFFDNSQPLTEVERERILLHEAVHVRQKHSWDILCLEVLKSVFWFNPLFYLYQKTLTSTHEFIADAAVLHTTEPEMYASLLAKQVFYKAGFSFGTHFNKSITLKRLHMIQQGYRRPNPLKQLLALPVFVLLLLVLSANTTSAPETIYSDYSSYYNKSQRPVPESFVEPMFPGGKEAMYTFLAKNLKYPSENLTTSREWIGLMVQVEIDENGNVKIPEQQNIPNQKASFVWGFSSFFRHEVYRVLRAMPNKWQPATINGKPVASKFLFDFDFTKSTQPEKAPFSLRQHETYELDLDDIPLITSRPIEVVLYDKNLSKSIYYSPTVAYHHPITTRVGLEVNQSGRVKIENTLSYEHKIQFPLFPGGDYKMNEYLHQNIRFRKYINNFGSNIAGAFTAVDIKIDEKGQVSTETSITDDDFAREIKQAINNMPTWQPAEVDGRPTASTYHLILMFKKDVEEGTPLLKEKLESFSNNDLKLTGILYGKRPYTLPNQPDELVFTVVEKKPEFPGGIEKMYEFLNQQIQYPEAARQAKLEGMVIAKFIVTKDGNIVEPRIDAHLSPETDAEF